MGIFSLIKSDFRFRYRNWTVWWLNHHRNRAAYHRRQLNAIIAQLYKELREAKESNGR